MSKTINLLNDAMLERGGKVVEEGPQVYSLLGDYQVDLVYSNARGWIAQVRGLQDRTPVSLLGMPEITQVVDLAFEPAKSDGPDAVARRRAARQRSLLYSINHHCERCQQPIDDSNAARLNLRISAIEGGHARFDNLMLLCAKCDVKKGTVPVEQPVQAGTPAPLAAPAPRQEPSAAHVAKPDSDIEVVKVNVHDEDPRTAETPAPVPAHVPAAVRDPEAAVPQDGDRSQEQDLIELAEEDERPGTNVYTTTGYWSSDGSAFTCTVEGSCWEDAVYNSRVQIGDSSHEETVIVSIMQRMPNGKFEVVGPGHIITDYVSSTREQDRILRVLFPDIDPATVDPDEDSCLRAVMSCISMLSDSAWRWDGPEVSGFDEMLKLLKKHVIATTVKVERMGNDIAAALTSKNG